MTTQFDPDTLLPEFTGDRGALLLRLMKLLDHIQWEPDRDILTIRNGAASISLEADGTIRIEGERIVETATQDITLAAGWIDLN